MLYVWLRSYLCRTDAGKVEVRIGGCAPLCRVKTIRFFWIVEQLKIRWLRPCEMCLSVCVISWIAPTSAVAVKDACHDYSGTFQWHWWGTDTETRGWRAVYIGDGDTARFYGVPLRATHSEECVDSLVVIAGEPCLTNAAMQWVALGSCAARYNPATYRLLRSGWCVSAQCYSCIAGRGYLLQDR